MDQLEPSRTRPEGRRIGGHCPGSGTGVGMGWWIGNDRRTRERLQESRQREGCKDQDPCQLGVAVAWRFIDWAQNICALCLSCLSVSAPTCFFFSVYPWIPCSQYHSTSKALDATRANRDFIRLRLRRHQSRAFTHSDSRSQERIKRDSSQRSKDQNVGTPVRIHIPEYVSLIDVQVLNKPIFPFV